MLLGEKTSFEWSWVMPICGVGLVFLASIIVCCYKKRNKRSSIRSASIESFQQLFFTKTSSADLSSKDKEQPIIERWSAANHPSLTFYRYGSLRRVLFIVVSSFSRSLSRVFVQTGRSDDHYRPVYSSSEQSKAMEYKNQEIIFF